MKHKGKTNITGQVDDYCADGTVFNETVRNGSCEMICDSQ